jgi:hypothetical protein
MTRRAAWNLAADLVDVLNIHLARVEAIQEAIFLMAEQDRDQEKIGTLADLAGDEVHKAHTGINEWWNNFIGNRQQGTR